MEQNQYDRIDNGLARAASGIAAVLTAGRRGRVQMAKGEADALRIARRHLDIAIEAVRPYDPSAKPA